MVNQSSLCYKDLILSHFVVINKRQTRTSDKLEKSCVVVFNMSKFTPNKEHRRTALIFCFPLRKTATESYRLFREAYGEHAPSRDTCEGGFRRLKSGDFDTRQEGRHRTWKNDKKIEDVELQALLDEDDSQTQKQLSEQLGVSQKAVSSRLREMGKIQNTSDGYQLS